MALRWLRTMCEALNVLHSNGLIHGDISPRNMIVSGSALVLTDYDFVTKIGEPVTAPGTILYCSSSHQDNRLASPADDIYALAARLFHVIFDKKPFQYNGAQAKDRGLNWEGVVRAEYPMLAAFLDKATRPDPEQRFRSAAEALAALKPSQAQTETEEEGAPGRPSSNVDTGGQTERHENQVEWLRSLLQSYPGSLWGNRETRGLDTDFSAQTYVETNLDAALRGDVLERRVRLVVLCGNAGDGKTALLQHLASRLGFGKRASSERILEKQMDDGLTVRMNLDGSAAWRGRSADDLLDEFLEPFQKGPPSDDVVHLLAINDGRLLEWIDGASETPLTSELYDLLGGEATRPESHIRFISLNHRSLVGSITSDRSEIETNFLERLLDQLYGGEKAAEIWSLCQTCSTQDRCEVFRATRIFGPDGLSGNAPEKIRTRARERLFGALQAVHLRGETHITIRELRAALVYILFGIQFCQDYHGGSGVRVPYWDRAFSPNSPGRQGEVLRELARFDPALEAHPQIDRHLLRASSPDSSKIAPHYDALSRDSARRRAYFEWTEEHIRQVAGEPQALDLARGRHLRLFQNLSLGDSQQDRATLCARLCRGISRLEDLPPQALDRPDVQLRITPRTPTETEFWVEKPITAFRLEAEVPAEVEGLDRMHRQAVLIYRYRDGREERLRLGAELFHLLLELSDGYQLGDVSTDDTFAHLSIFVQRLVREDDRHIFALNPIRDDVIYEVSADIKYTPAGAQQPLIIRRLTRGG